MDYEKMEFDEIKDYAKNLGLSVGNTGKEKLIAKIKEKEMERSNVKAVLTDDDSENKEDKSKEINDAASKTGNSDSLLDSISSAIDEMENSSGDKIEEIVELPNNYIVRVKSITFGGLTYRSRTTNAVFRWNQIGAVQDMTIAELNEMNNYKTDFLRKPLVILMDENAVKKFRLTSVYENVAKINNLTAVFNSGIKNVEKAVDDALRVNMRDILISKVRQTYKAKILVDINVIRLLEKKLQFDLSEAE